MKCLARVRKEYLQANQFYLKCFLVMEKTPAFPPDLDETLLDEFNFITVNLLPSNTTPLLQAMDKNVISNFKKLYSKTMFQRFFEVTSDAEFTLRDFWKIISIFSITLASYIRLDRG